MRTNRVWQQSGASKNSVRDRFKISEFTNPRTASKSWRVAGIKRDGGRVRENFFDVTAARCRQVELQMEWLARQTDTSVRATKLTETQLRLAEVAFNKLDADDDLLSAVDYWRKHGKKHSVAESPRLDDALKEFCGWLDGTQSLRDRTKSNLRTRVNVFVNLLGNHRISDVTPEIVESFLDKRFISPASKDNDKRAISRFFSWCIERPRRWAASNPCRDVHVERGEKPPPSVLDVETCRRLLGEAQRYKDGRLAPYVAVCLFGGLRPFETSRLTWGAVNITDNEIRLEASQTKTGRPRVVSICPTLRAWLAAYSGQEFYPSNWRKDFDAIKTAVGYGTPAEENPDLKPWPEDVLRHTAISHFFRLTGSYGQAAEQFGNSEAIIKTHYQGRVNSEDTKRFYAILPNKR